MEWPIVDGDYVSYAEITLRFAIPFAAPFETRDVTKIDWDDSKDPADVRGTGPDKLGQTGGQYSCAASMTMLRSKYKAFLRALKSASPNGKVSAVRFDVIVTWEPLDGEGELSTCEIIGCSIKSRKSSNAAGSDAAAIDIDLNPTKVIDEDAEL